MAPKPANTHHTDPFKRLAEETARALRQLSKKLDLVRRDLHTVLDRIEAMEKR